MDNSAIVNQVLADTSVLIKWVNEETNEHMQRMLISTIKLSQSITLSALAPDCNTPPPGLLSVAVAVKKLADVYKRSENNS